MNTTQQPRRFAHDVLRLMYGSTAAQVLAIIASPLIARLFAPAAFGIAAVFASITSMIAVVSALRYECSILLPQDDAEAANSAALSLLIVVVTTAVLVPAVWLGWSPLMRLLKEPGLEPYSWLVPLGVFVAGCLVILTNWNARLRAFGHLALAQIVTSVVNVTAQVAFGLTHQASGGMMIAANLLGAFAGTGLMAVQTWRESWTTFRRHVRWPAMMNALRRYARFPRYSTSSALMNNISWQLPAFMLSAFFSSSVVGQYALGTRLTRVPMNLLGLNISRVFNQRAAEARNNNTLSQTVETTFRYLVAITLFPCLLLGLVGKEVFVLAFGARWADAGIYCQILSVWVCFWFISSPLSSVFSVLEEQRLELRINVLILSSRFLSLLAGGLVGDARLALGFFSGTGVLVYGYYCMLILKLSGVSFVRMLKTLASHALLFAPCGALIGFLKLISAPTSVIVLVAVIALAVYYLHLLLTDAFARTAVLSLMGITPAHASHVTPIRRATLRVIGIKR